MFFKENLSTGWDCPRAETMMSFKHATDVTYIAQLLGRMVRTPMQMHIQVDEVLNDVHLYLPYFNENTVKDVVDALQNAEGGTIPTDIYGEPLSNKKFEMLTVKTKKKQEAQISGQMSLDLYGTGKIAVNSALSKYNIGKKQEKNPTAVIENVDAYPSFVYSKKCFSLMISVLLKSLRHELYLSTAKTISQTL